MNIFRSILGGILMIIGLVGLLSTKDTNSIVFAIILIFIGFFIFPKLVTKIKNIKFSNKNILISVISILIFGIIFVSYDYILNKNSKYLENYNSISKVNKTPDMSCAYAKEQVIKDKGNITFYNDCKVGNPGEYRDNVVGSFEGNSYICDVMYFDDGNFSEAICSYF